MKLKIQIKNRWTGSILFELETENNTLKNTLIEALKSGAYLRDANLSGAYLRDANLRDANLRGAYLRGAYLRDANLSDADLRGADLSGAYLRDANLSGADLRDADLSGADLSGADLSGADLRDADLSGAYLRGADLRDADLSGAYLSGYKIKKAAFFTGLYKYIVIPYITEENVSRIKMGCYDRTLEEWENDFWNNTSEFPNDNSEKSNLRLMAFNTAKAWLELVREKTEVPI